MRLGRVAAHGPRSLDCSDVRHSQARRQDRYPCRRCPPAAQRHPPGGPLSGDDPTDVAAALHAEAGEALEAVELARARGLAEQARALFVTGCGDDHPDVANSDLLQSRIAREAADYPAALVFAERAAASLAAAFREYPDEPVVAELLGEAAAQHSAVLVSLGRYDDGEAVAAAALPLVEAALGADSGAVATLCNALGICHKYQARWDEAAVRYARAIAILEAAYGDDAPELASLEHNLGGLAHARGEPALAEPHARRAIELRERALGPDHPSVAADLAAWAAVVDDLGRLDDAEAAYRRALTIFVAAHGERHYEVGFTLGALGALYAAVERWDDARRELTRAVAIQESLLAPEHPDVALLHHYLAVVEHGRGAAAAAASHAARAVDGFTRTFPADHPRVVDALQVQRAIAEHR